MMIKRLFWLGVGVAVGAIAVRQLTKAAQAYSPAGLAGTARNSAAGLIDSVRDFVADVRDGMAEREDQIQEAIARGVSLEELERQELDLGEPDEAEHVNVTDGDNTHGHGGYRRG